MSVQRYFINKLKLKFLETTHTSIWTSNHTLKCLKLFSEKADALAQLQNNNNLKKSNEIAERIQTEKVDFDDLDQCRGFFSRILIIISKILQDRFVDWFIK